MKFLESKYLGTGVALSLLLKLICVGLEPAEAAGAAILIAHFHLKGVLDYLYPKRPDLFREMIELKGELNTLNERFDDANRDLTALKIGAGRR